MTKEELVNLLIEITTAGQELQSAGMCGKDMKEFTAKCKELRKAVLTEFERLTQERDEASAQVEAARAEIERLNPSRYYGDDDTYGKGNIYKADETTPKIVVKFEDDNLAALGGGK